MITNTVRQCLNDEGIVSIVTNGKDFPHVVNTWNSYVIITAKGEFLIPVGRMTKTEENLKTCDKVLMTFGSRNVEGLQYIGTGFLVEGSGGFETSGDNFEEMKTKCQWIRAVWVIKPSKIEQTL